jgi:hypothetical protein
MKKVTFWALVAWLQNNTCLLWVAIRMLAKERAPVQSPSLDFRARSESVNLPVRLGPAVGRQWLIKAQSKSQSRPSI